jgi:TonB family protein
LSRQALFSPPRIPAHIYRSPVAEERSEIPTSTENFDSSLPPGISDNPGDFGSSPARIERPLAPVRVIQRSEKFEEGQLIQRVVPQYPQIARIARISGTVELLVLIGQDGRVKSIEVLSGNPMLAASAKAGVEQWRYRPAILDGHAVDVETRVTVHFVLNE